MSVPLCARPTLSIPHAPAEVYRERVARTAHMTSSVSRMILTSLAASLLIAVLTCCGPRIGSGDWKERRDAVDRVSDQKVLAKVAMSDPAPFVRIEAAKRLTDDSLKVEVAMKERNEPNPEAGVAAVERLNDQTLLAKVAGQAPNWDVRTAAIRKIPDQGDLYELTVEGSPTRQYEVSKNWEAKRCLTRMKIATLEPLIKSHFPRLQCEGTIADISQDYGMGTAALATLKGEQDTIRFLQDGGTIAQASWSTEFPNSTQGFGFVPAKISCGDVMKQLLHQDAFTLADLSELSYSYIPEVREGARWNIEKR
jgi:hypothetical protein